MKKSSLDCVTSSVLVVSVSFASKGLDVSVSASVLFSKPVRAEVSFASIVSVNTESSNSSIQSKVSSIYYSPFLYLENKNKKGSA